MSCHIVLSLGKQGLKETPMDHVLGKPSRDLVSSVFHICFKMIRENVSFVKEKQSDSHYFLIHTRLIQCPLRILTSWMVISKNVGVYLKINYVMFQTLSFKYLVYLADSLVWV